MNARFLFAATLVVAVFFLTPTILAAQSANIDVRITPEIVYANGPASKTVTMSFTRAFDGSDGPSIDQVDAYLLDLSESNLAYQNHSGTGWNFEHITIYNDEHFWIKNAWDQNLTVSFNFTGKNEGEYIAQGYYQFYDNDGGTTGLGDNRAYYPLLDIVDHAAFKVIIDKTNPIVRLSNPLLESTGLRVDGNVIENNPLSTIVLSYNKPGGQAASVNLPINTNKDFNYLIPSVDLVEGTILTYTVTATDGAGNSGSDSKTFEVSDVPQFQNVGPTTFLPDTNFSFWATVTDASGIKDVNMLYRILGGPLQTVFLSASNPPSANRFVAAFNGLPPGTIVDYNLVASDNYGNFGRYNSSFSMLRSFDVNFLVLDFFTHQPVSNVTLTVSNRVVNTGSTTFTIPTKTLTFDQQVQFAQWEGGPYTFVFSNSNYDPSVISFSVNANTDKVVYLGGSGNTIKRADIIPQVSDNNLSFNLQFEVEINEKVPVKTAQIRYSLGSGTFDQTVELVKGADGVYRALLGPFQDQIVLYSHAESTDIGDQLLLHDFGIRWYSLLGVLSGILPEICGNETDDNNNGLIDEGCVCPKTGETRICSNNVGTCKEGFQRCQDDGKWSDSCENGISPVREVCSNKMDEDCDGIPDDGCELDSDRDGLLDAEELTITTDPLDPDTDSDNVEDGQEFLYDNTDPKDANKNLLFIDLKKTLSVGETQYLSIRHPQLGVIPAASFLIESPSGKQTEIVQKESTSIGYLALESGAHTVRASKKKFLQIKSFAVEGTILSPLVGGVGSGIGFVFGEKALELPLNFLFLLLLCIVIGVLSRDLFKIWNRDKVFSTDEERRRTMIGIAFVGAVSISPLVFFRFFPYEIALAEAFATIILIFASAQVIRRSQQKTIRV